MIVFSKLNFSSYPQEELAQHINYLQVYQKNLEFDQHRRSIVKTLLAPDTVIRLATNLAEIGVLGPGFLSCLAYPKVWNYCGYL